MPPAAAHADPPGRRHQLFSNTHACVQVRLPPKALTLQMSLTPTPTELPPAARGAEHACGVENDGMLHPLHMHATDAAARMRSLVRLMLGDLLGRVWHDGWALCY